MKSDKIQQFMEIADQSYASRFSTGSDEERALGAQLLLSEVLEYVVHGLGVVPLVDGHPVLKPNDIEYRTEYDGKKGEPDKKEMVDGLADVAYTMFWNKVKFGVPLEEAFELVCDNNLSKFVELPDWKDGAGPVDREGWGLGKEVRWPESVVAVEIVKIKESFFAVGKDSSGKVRKPSTYESVDLGHLVD